MSDPGPGTLQFGDAATRRIQRIYLTPDMTAQRARTLVSLNLHPGERVIDIGTGPGFLAASMAQAVGSSGTVAGIDTSSSMLALARVSCAAFPWAEFHEADATQLPVDAASFDVAVSTQVYEYVADVDAALAEVRRVLRPSGRCVIVDTDWASIVWAHSDDEFTSRLLRVWDEHLVDPHLPRTLGERLRRGGFAVDAVDGIPIVNTVYDDTAYSHGMSELIGEFVTGRRGITESDVAGWLADFEDRHRDGSYFFSLNRYQFVAHKL